MNEFEEAFHMFQILGECRGNYRNAAEIFNDRFPKPQKSHMKFFRLKNRFFRNGCVKVKRNKLATITNEENSINITTYVRLHLHASCRQISRESGMSVGSVINILHEYKFHPYYMHQDLRGNDFLNRVNFYNWILRKIDRNPLFLFSLMFSDECTFTITGQCNRHNMHYWSEINPYWMRQIPHQHPWSLNV